MSEISQELAQRMAALVRDLYADHIKHGAHDYVQDFVARTAAIVAELPNPVDPVLLKAREIRAARYEADGDGSDEEHRQRWARFMRDGAYDDDRETANVIEGIRAGIEMAKA